MSTGKLFYGFTTGTYRSRVCDFCELPLCLYAWLCICILGPVPAVSLQWLCCLPCARHEKIHHQCPLHSAIYLGPLVPARWPSRNTATGVSHGAIYKAIFPTVQIFLIWGTQVREAFDPPCKMISVPVWPRVLHTTIKTQVLLWSRKSFYWVIKCPLCQAMATETATTAIQKIANSQTVGPLSLCGSEGIIPTPHNNWNVFERNSDIRAVLLWHLPGMPDKHTTQDIFVLCWTSTASDHSTLAMPVSLCYSLIQIKTPLDQLQDTECYDHC